MKQVIGFCRFSFLGDGDWKRPNKLGVADATREVRFATMADYLFEAERMEFRFRCFEKFCLPSIVNQTDQDFLFVLLVSETMPEAYLERLDALCAPFENILLFPASLQPVRKVTYKFITQLLGCEIPDVIQFRLDDDDGLPLDHVEWLKAAAAATGERPGTSYSFGRSLTVCAYEKEPVRTLMMTQPFLGAGLAIIGSDEVPTVFSGGHFTFKERMEPQVDTDRVGSLCMKHDDNDSRYITDDPVELARLNFLPVAPDEFDKMIEQGFPFYKDINWHT